MLGFVVEHPVKELSQKADKLSNYLLGRHPPTSENSLIMKANQLYKEIAERNGQYHFLLLEKSW